jgi:hypothetical protein
MDRKFLSRTCHFCGGPGDGGFYRDVGTTVDHVLTKQCWARIEQLRKNDVSRLSRLLAPTSANFEFVRDTYDGCKNPFTVNRYSSRRIYDMDSSIHDAIVAQFFPQGNFSAIY